MTKPALLLPLFLILHASAVSAAEPATCMSRAEATNLVQFVLPDAFTGVADSCKASLPADAFLVRDREKLAARYLIRSSFAANGARVALGKISGMAAEDIAKLSNETVRNLLAVGVQQAIGKGIGANDCRIIDQVLEQLEPLPPENMANLLAIAMVEGNRAKQAKGTAGRGLNICPEKTGN